MNLVIELQISCSVKETGLTQLMCETDPSEVFQGTTTRAGHKKMHAVCNKTGTANQQLDVINLFTKVQGMC